MLRKPVDSEWPTDRREDANGDEGEPLALGFEAVIGLVRVTRRENLPRHCTQSKVQIRRDRCLIGREESLEKNLSRF